ncbi:cytosine deaminase [Bifidobacterium sp. DSM 109958]|uniref:Cytosine deaminase n=1 Tax=Bifidobacterium moraviense TaxID=2675323 RepID=A0A7Y0F0W6_9BIFI|nr:cytosine deaminase [Bifidobacterium sp. DSM 109958]NMM99967.1 cytosine deaminase [Bifidobacterium sp. DSM 109958]
MLISNVNVDNAGDLKDVRIENGTFAAIEPAGTLAANPGEETIDGEGRLLLPPFVDPHIHLDSTGTAGDPEWNETGTLFDGIRIWAERKKSLTVRDVKDRARATIRRQVEQGIQCIRTHADVTDSTLTGLHALLELRDELRDVVDLQVVAFPQDGILSFPHGRELMEQAVKDGADVVGGIPHFEFTRQYGVESVHFLMDLAEKYDKLVDVHCDEIDDPQSRNLEVLATLALERGMGDRVTASHTTAMGSYNDAYAYKLMRLLKMSGISFVSNPLVNVHLGGRFDTYPKRRGVTRIHELAANGINVALGEDDVRDPWNPLGDGNMLDVAMMGVYIEHMMGYGQIQNAFRFVTYNGAKAMHITDRYGIEVGKPGNCILLDAPDFYTALNTHAPVLANVRAGRVIVRRPAVRPEVDAGGLL